MSAPLEQNGVEMLNLHPTDRAYAEILHQEIISQDVNLDKNEITINPDQIYRTNNDPVPFQGSPTPNSQNNNPNSNIPNSRTPNTVYITTEPSTDPDFIPIPMGMARLLANAHLYTPEGEAGKLFNEMSLVVGANNIIPPPPWLRHNEEQKKFLKQNHNALLYYLTRTKKYKKQLQSLLDSPLCCQYIWPAGQKWKHQSCCVGRWMCAPLTLVLPLLLTPLCAFLCCCPAYCTYGTCGDCSDPNPKWMYRAIEPSLSSTISSSMSNGDWVKFRNKVKTAAIEAGLEYDDCYDNYCCQIWCSCCYLSKYSGIVDWYIRKRYGHRVWGSQYTSWGMNRDKMNKHYDNPQWKTYIEFLTTRKFKIPNKPHYSLYTREGYSGEVKLFEGWRGDIDDVIKTHQQHWGMVRKIRGEEIRVPKEMDMD
jgi:hypothetical protein